MQELFPGIYQVNITLKGFSPGSVNLYVWRDRGKLTLIDTGWDLPAAVESLQSQLAEAGMRLEDIHQVLVTHCHSDHLGMINRLKKENGARIYLHKNDLDIIRARYNGRYDYWQNTDQFLYTHGLPPSELPSLGYPLPEIGDLVDPDVWLEGDEVIPVGDYRLRVINTPGHSPGHVAYYEPEQHWAFVGDTLLPTIATNAATHIQHMVNPLQQYLDSLRRLDDLDIALVCPGHEYPFADYHRRIAELVEHHNLRSAAVQTQFSPLAPSLSAYAVARRIAWSPKNKAITWEQLSTWDKRFAMMQSIAHLEFLVFEKVLLRSTQNGKISYQFE
jgi:glyoxylase-like metal-dependent hydrolase (beta-lactamase superfamily II)